MKTYNNHTSYEDEKINPTSDLVSNALISPEKYFEEYKKSISDPETFWGNIAEQELDWIQKWDKVFEQDGKSYKWFTNAKLNLTHNSLDRHIRNGKGSKIAYIYTNEDKDEKTITYAELSTLVNKLGNGLKSLGIKKGDTVTIYMPLTIEIIATMLACARIGAVHSLVFAGFSSKALKSRIEDAKSKIVITATSTKRRGKVIDLKGVVDEAVEGLGFVEKIVVFNRGMRQEASGKAQAVAVEMFDRTSDTNEKQQKTQITKNNEINFYTLIEGQSDELEAEVMDSEDPLFILYTSGSTGKPKGILHTTGGYNLYTHYTSKLSFDLHEDDIYWCTADCGWITGHSYVVYGPLSNGVTSIIFEGAPDYPTPEIWWEIIEKYKVTKFYTAPTAIRMFMKHGEALPKKHDLTSLKILGSVGEPINPEAWKWYYKNIGNSKATVIDTWWQTETAGHVLVTMPSMSQKPGRAGLPFLGLDVDVVNSKGEPVEPNTQGFLVIKKPWPSALRTCWNNAERFEQYWSEIKDYYNSGDIALKDEEGYITVLGRSDDVIKIAGHRLGSAELESSLVDHEAVAESAVIGIPDEVKGEIIKAFVILKKDVQNSPELIESLKQHVKKEIGSFATPSEIEIVEKLPKTRSGKIMRRVLRAQETGEELGDVSTLEE